MRCLLLGDLPARVQRRCPDNSGSDASRPCPRTARRRSGRARRSAWRTSCSKVRPAWDRRHFAFLAGLHIDAVDALAVGGVGEADGKFAGVILRLRHALGQFFIPRLGLDDGELGVAILQNVICRERFAALPWPSMRPGAWDIRAGCGCPRPRPSLPLSTRDQCVRRWFRLRS